MPSWTGGARTSTRQGRMEQPGSTTPIEPFSGGRGNLVSVGSGSPGSAAEAEFVTPLLASLVSRALKRAMDLVGSAIALIVLSPLLVILTMVLAIETGGHPIFVQQRVGRFGSPFRIFKFRTMAQWSEDQLQGRLQGDEKLAREWGSLRKLRDDPRVTRMGRVLRKYSLDELPQFVNVLLGQMSLVGPRPVVEEELPLFGRHLQAVLTMRPGLTGLWGISGRNDLGYDERVQLEDRYARVWTLRLDISILLRTIPRVIRARGAF
jgi:exopolysaccharide production protein ExoY